MTFYVENFSSISEFMAELQKRPDNPVKQGDSSHKRSSDGWSGTVTWEDAEEQFMHGIPERCTMLKSSLREYKLTQGGGYLKKRRPENYYTGHSPNVPAAIMGLPKSMRRVKTVKQKVKTLNLYYDACMSAMTEPEDLQKAGETVLKAVYLLEKMGYRVQLTGIPFTGYDGKETVFVSIKLKDYRQPLDLLKLSFPLTSPAMFRRFGFRYLETHPNITHVFSGYGVHLSKQTTMQCLEKSGVNLNNSYVITVPECEEAGYNPENLIKALKIELI